LAATAERHHEELAAKEKEVELHKLQAEVHKKEAEEHKKEVVKVRASAKDEVEQHAAELASKHAELEKHKAELAAKRAELDKHRHEAAEKAKALREQQEAHKRELAVKQEELERHHRVAAQKVEGAQAVKDGSPSSTCKNLQPKEVNDLKEIWEYMDANHDGGVTFEELAHAIKTADAVELSRSYMEHIDKDGNDRIEMGEWLDFWNTRASIEHNPDGAFIVAPLINDVRDLLGLPSLCYEGKEPEEMAPTAASQVSCGEGSKGEQPGGGAEPKGPQMTVQQTLEGVFDVVDQFGTELAQKNLLCEKMEQFVAAGHQELASLEERIRALDTSVVQREEFDEITTAWHAQLS